MAVKASYSITIASINDVTSASRYYLLQSSTLAAPSKPTANPPGGSWATTEPTYSEGSTNSLYTCDQTIFSDGTWAYSAVSLSSSYEAAKAAYNAAVAAGSAAAQAKTYVCSCSTAAATAAKVATADGFSLATGSQVAVTFAEANTAASPTLNVNSTGAKPIVMNGSNSVYWLAGALVSMVYDGASWQVVVPALYGATATIGNPGGGNVYVDGSSVNMRQASSTHTSFSSSGAAFLSGKSAIKAYTSNGISSIGLYGDSAGVHSTSGVSCLDCSDSHGSASITVDSNVDSGNDTARVRILAKQAGAKAASGIDIYSVNGDAGSIVALNKTSLDNLRSAISRTVLYNGGAALTYDVAPGAGTTGTVTLSETAAHFKEILLYLTDNNGLTAGVFTVAALPGATTVANGQTADCFGFEAAHSDGTWTFIRRTRYTVTNGTKLVPSNGGWVSFRNGAGVGYSNDGVNYLRIYRVTGRR